MSNFTDKIKELFSKNAEKFTKHGITLKFSEDAPKEFMAEAKLADGTIIKTTASEWVAGSDAYMIGEGGAETPLTAGEYELETGEVLVIGEDGMVAELKVKEVEEEVEMSTDVVELINALTGRVTELETKLSASETELETVKQENTNAKAQLSAKTLEVERLKKKPATESVTEKFTSTKKEEAKSDEPKQGSREWFMSFTNKK